MALTQQTREELTLGEAGPLCVTVVLRLLDDAGVGALAVKGPAFAALGVRPPRVSSDADVLVCPGQTEAALASLRTVGWRDWAPEKLLEPFGAHSITLEHDLWPCSLDLHWRFPGFLAPPVDVFDLLWADRTLVKVAHQQVATLSRPHALALDCLNAIRGRPQEFEEATIRYLLSAMPEPLDPEEMATLGSFLSPSGSAETLATLAGLIDASPGTAGRTERSAEPNAALDQWRTLQRLSGVTLGWWFEEWAKNPLKASVLGLRHTFLSDGQARTWAKYSGVPYRNRWQVLRLRAAKGVRALGQQLRRRRASD